MPDHSAGRGARQVDFLLCRRNEPVAEIRALPRARTKRRPFGLARGQFKVPDSFFEPLPDDILDAFQKGPVFPEE